MKISKLLIALFLSFYLTAGIAGDTVDINTADAKTIAQVLDGVGEKKAAAIVQYRADNGPFKSVGDLSKVKGIGKATLKKNKGKITASAPAK